MKCWRPIASVVLCFLASLLLAGTALAQGGAGPLPPILARALAKLAVLVDGVLGFWVTGNTLTDPSGRQLVADLGQIAVNVVDFLARLVILF